MAARKQLEPFKLQINDTAQREWHSLDNSIKTPFKKKLKKLLTRETVPSPHDALTGFPPGYYKIKLRKIGYRLVYFYDNEELKILLITVGRRQGNEVYKEALRRIK